MNRKELYRTYNSIINVEPEFQSDIISWQGHIPFAFSIIKEISPKIFVELGTHKGDSYLAFCQAVQHFKRLTKCYAVDTWKGDKHSGFYGEEVYTELKKLHDKKYGKFSELIRSNFENALNLFQNKSIDLLHIDGLHTYRSAQQNFLSWLPKLSNQAVILLHDIIEKKDDFGVYKLWDEISCNYPTFYFKHGHGLGVIAVGKKIPEYIDYLCNLELKDSDKIRKIYENMGRAVAYKGSQKLIHLKDLNLTDLNSKLLEKEKIISDKITIIEAISKDLNIKDSIINEKNNSISDKDKIIKNEIIRGENLLKKKDKVIQKLEFELSEMNTQIVSKDNQLKMKDKIIDSRNESLNKKDALLVEKEKIIQSKEQIIVAKEASLNDKERLLGEKDTVINSKEQIIVAKEASLNDKDQLLGEKNKFIDDKIQIILEMDAALVNKDRLLFEKEIIIKNKDLEIVNLKNECFKKDSHLRKKDKTISEIEVSISDQNETIKKLSDVIDNLSNMNRDLERKLNEFHSTLLWNFSIWMKNSRKNISYLLEKPLFYPIKYLYWAFTLQLIQIIKAKKYYKVVKECGLFNSNYYLEKYNDVYQSAVDPLWHYIRYGEKEGRNPNSWFDPNFYLKNNPDVQTRGIKPFLHYVLHGKNEGRIPSNTNFENLNDQADDETCSDKNHQIDEFSKSSNTIKPIKNRFLFISTNDGPFGGSEDLWCLTALKMRNQGFEIGVSLIKRDPEPKMVTDLVKAGCTIYHRNDHYSPKIYKPLLKYSPCMVVISQGNSFEADNWMQLFHSYNIPYVNIIQCVHEATWIYLPDQRINHFISLFNGSKRLFFVAEANKYLTEKMIGKKINNAEIIRNPFKVNYDVKLEWPNEERLHVAVVARLECFHKGHDLLLEVLRKAKWKNRKIDFHFYGSGPHENQLKRLAQMWDIRNIYFEGYENEIANIWKKCHAGIQPSRLEGTPLSVVEAMLCNRMVIATNVAGNSEIITDSVNGYLAKAATSEFLEEAMEKAWQNRELWREMGDAAGKQIRKLVPKDPVDIFVDKIIKINQSTYERIEIEEKEIDQSTKSQNSQEKKIKLLFISHEGEISGAPMVLLHLAKWLRKNTDWELNFLTRANGPLIKQFKKLGQSYCLNDSLSKAEIFDNVDLVYSNTCTNDDIISLIKNSKIPVITHIHELNAVMQLCLNNNLENIKNRSSHLIACSNNVAKNLISNYDISNDFISVCYESVPVEEIKRKAIEISSAEIRKSLNINENDFMVVACGLAHWRKGTDLFIHAANRLKNLCKNIDKKVLFIWIGRIISRDTEISYKHDILNLGLQDTCLFVGEKINPFPLIAASDVFCLPSREDPFPLVMLEAAALGKPGVCFADTGGGPEFYSHGCGKISSYLDFHEMADFLLNYLKNPIEKKQDGELAEKIVKEKYHSDIMSSSIAQIIYKYLPHPKKLNSGIFQDKNNNPILNIDAKKKIKHTSTIKLGDSFPLVSVVLPNYNYAHYLNKRIETILNQSYKKLEIIILDDNSSDDSRIILKKYSGQNNIKTVINNRNSGSVFKQWVKGARQTKGEFLWIAEADDLCEKNFIECLLPKFDDTNTKLAYCNSHCIDDEGKFIFNYNYQNDYLCDLSPIKWLNSYNQNGLQEICDGLSIKNTIPNVSAVLFRKKSLFENLQEFESEIENFQFCGDWNLYLRLLRNGNISYIPDKLNYHRRHNNSVTNNCSRAHTSADIILKEYYLNHKYVVENYYINSQLLNKMISFVFNELRTHNFPLLSDKKLKSIYNIERLKTQCT